MKINKQPDLPLLAPLLLWILTMIFFVGLLFLESTTPAWSQKIPEVLFFDLSIGVLAWAYLVWSADKHLHSQYRELKATLISFSFGILSLFIGIGLIILSLALLSPYMTHDDSSTKIAQKKEYKLINTQMKLGSISKDVEVLQAVLKTDGDLYPQGIVNGYFGSLTEQAVQNFQEKHDLPQTGIVDEATINAFNKAYGDKPQAYYLPPSIIPTAVYIPTQDTAVTSIESDPIINCSIHANCGGGTRQLRQSECSNSTCCQVGNQYIVYTDKNKCTQDQNAYVTNTKNNGYIYTDTYNNQQSNTPSPQKAPTNPQAPENAPVPTTDYTAIIASCQASAIRAIEEDCRQKANYYRAIGAGDSSAFTNLCGPEAQYNRKYEAAKDCELRYQ